MSKNLFKALNDALESGVLFEIVDSSLSASSVLNKLGYSDKGQYVSIVKDYLLSNDIVIDHFTANGRPKIQQIVKVCPVCSNSFKCFPRKTDEQITCSKSCSNTYFRTKDDTSDYRGLALKNYGCKCNRCGYSENIAAIVVHHRDHNRNNNDLSNLEVLCANCHAIHHYG